MGDEPKSPVEWVAMPDGEEWLLRPVIEGMCHYESLRNGVIDLEDIAKMNDALDVKATNEARNRKAQE